jgi:hypothetical protein
MRNSSFRDKLKVSAFNKSQCQAESKVLFNPLLLLHANRNIQLKKMKRLFSILFLLSNGLVFSQNYSTLILDKQINEFIEWELKTNSKKNKIYCKIAEWTDLNFNKIENISQRDLSYSRQFLFTKENNLDTKFSKTDREFLIDQKNSIKLTEWKSDFENGKISKKRKKRYIYSIPLFSKDQNLVLIYKEYWMGREHATGCYYLYKKNIIGWELVGTYNCWMS